MKCGIVNIKEDTCQIVCCDDIRNCVIIDTKQKTYVNFDNISNGLQYVKYRNNLFIMKIIEENMKSTVIGIIAMVMMDGMINLDMISIGKIIIDMISGKKQILR